MDRVGPKRHRKITIGLLVMSVFGGSALIWLICPTPSLISLPYYLKFLT